MAFSGSPDTKSYQEESYETEHLNQVLRNKVLRNKAHATRWPLSVRFTLKALYVALIVCAIINTLLCQIQGFPISPSQTHSSLPTAAAAATIERLQHLVPNYLRTKIAGIMEKDLIVVVRVTFLLDACIGRVQFSGNSIDISINNEAWATVDASPVESALSLKIPRDNPQSRSRMTESRHVVGASA